MKMLSEINSKVESVQKITQFADKENSYSSKPDYIKPSTTVPPLDLSVVQDENNKRLYNKRGSEQV